MNHQRVTVTPQTLAVMLGIGRKQAIAIAKDANAIFRLNPHGKMWISVAAIKEVLGERIEIEYTGAPIVKLPALCVLMECGAQTAKAIASMAGAEYRSGDIPLYSVHEIDDFVRKLASSYSRVDRLTTEVNKRESK